MIKKTIQKQDGSLLVHERLARPCTVISGYGSIHGKVGAGEDPRASV
jgi:hypothetical protein